MTIKEKISIATQAKSLAWTKSDEDHDERAVDRVAALGMAQIRSRANSMGALLWRLKFGGDHSFHTRERAYWLLVEHAHGKGNMREISVTLKAICRIALDEWMGAPCPTCKGRNYVGAAYDSDKEVKAGKTKACPACHGFGTLPKSPEQRARAVTMLMAKWEQVAAARVKPNRTPRPVTNMLPIWSKGWDAQYDKALEYLKEREAMLGGAVKVRLGEAENNS